MERLQGETVLRRYQGAEHTQETVRVMLEHQAERGDNNEVSQNKKAQMLDGAEGGGTANQSVTSLLTQHPGSIPGLCGCSMSPRLPHTHTVSWYLSDSSHKALAGRQALSSYKRPGA